LGLVDLCLNSERFRILTRETQNGFAVAQLFLESYRERNKDPDVIESWPEKAPFSPQSVAVPERQKIHQIPGKTCA